MYLDRKKTPYELGYAAGKNGDGWGACPFMPMEHSQDYRDWMRGQADGIRDRKLSGMYNG
jgi:ribosome modulation factor